jgi:hypothetical protein
LDSEADEYSDAGDAWEEEQEAANRDPRMSKYNFEKMSAIVKLDDRGRKFTTIQNRYKLLSNRTEIDR